MRLLQIVLTGSLLTCLTGNTAQAQADAQGMETRGTDGALTGFVRSADGSLRRKVDGLVVRFFCSPSAVLLPHEIEATSLGAPECSDGLSATLWYCVPKEGIEPHNRRLISAERGQPDCGGNFAATRQPVFPNVKGEPHGGPLLVYDGGSDTRLLCLAPPNIKPDMTVVTAEGRARLKTDRRCPEGEVLVLLPVSVPPLFDTRPPMREPSTSEVKP